MKIVLLGNLRAEFSTENDIRKTLFSMGHSVDCVQEDGADGEKILQLAREKNAALIIWMHTHGWDFPNREVLVGASTPVVAYTLDLFRGLARHQLDYVETYPWFKARYFFSPDGDSDSWWRQRGVNHFWSLPGILESSCYLADKSQVSEAAHRIIFVGSRNYHPEWPWRSELLAWLEKTYSNRFVLFEHSSGMRGHRLNVLYASAAVVVGDSCFAGKRANYTSDRLFETIGRGGNLVYPYFDGIPEDAPCVLYKVGDFLSLQKAIDSAMNMAYMESRRLRMIAWARTQHTYRQRMERLFTVLAEHEPSIKEALGR